MVGVPEKQEIQILFVEDVVADEVMVGQELSKAGMCFRLKRVDNQKAFLRELRQHPPDIILSDHGLPSFDAFTALAIGREKCPDVPFIFVTGSLGEEKTIETFESGATDYVLKKNLHQLGPAVRRALREVEERAARQYAEEQLYLLNEQLEQRVEARTAELEAANKELEAFSYSVSHDLRAPLRHIAGYVDILQSEAGAWLDGSARQHLETIAMSVRQLGHLIDALLAFSRMGRAEMRAERVSLAALVEDARRELRRDTDGRDIEWRIGKLPEVLGDPIMLRQAILNLLSNALKYTRTRSRAKIEIGAKADRYETVFFIRDNGVGFNMKYADKLFRVFQRLHPPRAFEGTGIGLANVHRIIHRHGGKVWAEGAVNGGATFYFSLRTPPKKTSP